MSIVDIATVSAQGQVYQVRRHVVSAQHKRRGGGGLRGKITSFSRASRRRLIDLTLRLDTSHVRCTFLTLTFSGVPSWEEARAAFKRFTMRLRRAHPDMSAIWRQEKQDRGAIHFHLILFNFPYIPQKDLQTSWTECTLEQRSIVHVKLLNSARAVFNYVSKYVAKADAPASAPSLDEGTYQHAVSTGRHWGYINRAALPFAERFDYLIEGADCINYALWACYALSHGKARRQTQAAKLFCQDAVDMLKHTLRIAARQGWQVREELRRRVWWRNLAKMPFVRSYAFVHKIGWTPSLTFASQLRN